MDLTLSKMCFTVINIDSFLCAFDMIAINLSEMLVQSFFIAPWCSEQLLYTEIQYDTPTPKESLNTQPSIKSNLDS